MEQARIEAVRDHLEGWRAVDPAAAQARVETFGEVSAHSVREHDDAIETGMASDQAWIDSLAQQRTLRHQHRPPRAQQGGQVPVARQVEEAVEDEHGVRRELGDQWRDLRHAVAVARFGIGQDAPAEIDRRAAMVHRELEDVPARGQRTERGLDDAGVARLIERRPHRQQAGPVHIRAPAQGVYGVGVKFPPVGRSRALMFTTVAGISGDTWK